MIITEDEFIMPETKQDFIDAHRNLWDWLSENPEMDKEDWPGFDIYDEIYNECFSCEYGLQKNENNVCGNCFIDWDHTNFCMCDGSFYFDWMNIKRKLWNSAESDPLDLEELSKLAATIRDLPIVEDV
jgi:hypothetical protein